MIPIKSTHRTQLYRWILWFYFITSMILCSIQLSFLRDLPNLLKIHNASPGKVLLAGSYLLAAYITQASILAFGTGLIPALITLLRPKTYLIIGIGTLLATILVTVQIMDMFTFNLYHAHEILIGLTIIKSGAIGQVIPLSLKEIGLIIAIIITALSVQSTIALLLWRQINKHQFGHQVGHWISALVITCVFFSYGMMASVVSLPKPFQIKGVIALLILKTSRFVPYFTEIYKHLIPSNNTTQHTIYNENGSLSYQTGQPKTSLHYPSHPLLCTTNKSTPNILWIIIDTWRFDSMNAMVTPNIAHFAAKTSQFRNHWSGGNCTQSGIFALFYGIPANYWNACLTHQKGPVFIKILKQHHYRLNIEASASLLFPQFNRTIFADITHLKVNTPGKNTLTRDINITQGFINFLNKHHKSHRPFFSFIFYDAAHNYCGGGPKVLQSPFTPAIKKCARFSLSKHSDRTPYFNRYRNALHFIDDQVGKILKKIKHDGLEKNTIIIITTDHGEQFNDQHLGFWTHNSAYSSYQLHVPMLLYWPGRKPEKISRFTTHFDLIPTLLTEVFACDNPTTDYSSGHSLFKKMHIPFAIVGNYNDYAVLTKRQITRFYPDGDYAILAPTNKPIPFARINPKIIKKVNKELNRFFSKD